MLCCSVRRKQHLILEPQIVYTELLQHLVVYSLLPIFCDLIVALADQCCYDRINQLVERSFQAGCTTLRHPNKKDIMNDKSHREGSWI